MSMPDATGTLAQNILYFARALRAAGLPIGSGAVLDALTALAADTAGQITLNGAYATKIFSSFVPNDTLHCISSVTATPLTVIAR